MRERLAAVAVFVTSLALAAPALAFERTEVREDCDHHDPLRRPFFGDTHVHTTFSFDAWAQGTRNRPRDAYRFARGEALGIQPYGPDGTPRRTLRLRRPLDFAMVSDHAEMLGETQLCRTPGSPGHGSFACLLMRRWPRLGYMIVNSQWSIAPRRRADLCGGEPARCVEASRGPWKETQEAAEAFYDRTSACRFTTFVGFEWSGSRGGMIHRNVVFRNATVPDLPPNARDDGNDERRLWEQLEEDCIGAGAGCDALAIPHNSNWSQGSMFWTVAPDGEPLSAELARRRAALEPLVEITQHKGDSECRRGSDPLCDFETPEVADLAGTASVFYRDPPPPGVYVREGLVEGLRQQERLGENPFAFGIIGATDTHLGAPGLVDEDAFVGHAAGLVTARLEVPPLPDQPEFNPGGLGVLWAEENSRDALFAAMRRREAYGTSGPRMVVRFFGGWDYSASLCDEPDFAAAGYAGGVPMGGNLPPAPGSGGAPLFAARASADAGTDEAAGTPLERIQIVKGWLEDGVAHERVLDVAGDESGADVDLATCEPRGAGADSLCAVWRDPDFDPTSPAFYYARVVENPTCRWSWRSCLAAGVRCEEKVPSGPLAACCEADVPRTVRERAWTSPIWYTPPGAVSHAGGP
jgi:hypothetical protein